MLRRNTCRQCYAAQRKNHTDDDKPDGLTCKKCGEYKLIAGFTRNRQCLYGVEPVCKACKRQRRREYIRLYPERARNADLKYQYGITIEQYHAMFVRQGGRCAICGTAESKLVVDHNHRTGRVRELLCHLCNAMIGCAREDIAILTSAVAYLQREQQRVPTRDLIAVSID
jgi:Recombination endonuclease VII